MTFETFMREHFDRLMAPWCKCICRTYPDGTMCKLCRHAHESPTTPEPKP